MKKSVSILVWAISIFVLLLIIGGIFGYSAYTRSEEYRKKVVESEFKKLIALSYAGKFSEVLTREDFLSLLEYTNSEDSSWEEYVDESRQEIEKNFPKYAKTLDKKDIIVLQVNLDETACYSDNDCYTFHRIVTPLGMSFDVIERDGKYYLDI